jgi:hypothetical protein
LRFHVPREKRAFPAALTFREYDSISSSILSQERVLVFKSLVFKVFDAPRDQNAFQSELGLPRTH